MACETPVTASVGESLVMTIVESVADRKGVDETELPPIGHVVDVDSLAGLVASSSDPHVQFRYEGCLVQVDGGGETPRVSVRSSEARDDR